MCNVHIWYHLYLISNVISIGCSKSLIWFVPDNCLIVCCQPCTTAGWWWRLSLIWLSLIWISLIIFDCIWFDYLWFVPDNCLPALHHYWLIMRIIFRMETMSMIRLTFSHTNSYYFAKILFKGRASGTRAVSIMFDKTAEMLDEDFLKRNPTKIKVTCCNFLLKSLYFISILEHLWTLAKLVHLFVIITTGSCFAVTQYPNKIPASSNLTQFHF